MTEYRITMATVRSVLKVVFSLKVIRDLHAHFDDTPVRSDEDYPNMISWYKRTAAMMDTLKESSATEVQVEDLKILDSEAKAITSYLNQFLYFIDPDTDGNQDRKLTALANDLMNYEYITVPDIRETASMFALYVESKEQEKYKDAAA